MSGIMERESAPALYRPPAIDILETFSDFFQEDSITVQSEIQKFRVEHIHILT